MGILEEQVHSNTKNLGGQYQFSMQYCGSTQVHVQGFMMDKSSLRGSMVIGKHYPIHNSGVLYDLRILVNVSFFSQINESICIL